MEIRRATLNDVSVIAQLFLNCWKISYEEVIDNSERENMNLVAATNLWTVAMQTNFERETFIGIVGGEVIGFFRIGPEENDPAIGHLFSLYVEPATSGRGHGKSLLSSAIKFLESRKFNSISLWVFKENTAARSLYNKFGFVPTGNEKTSLEWKTPEIEMLKTSIS